MEFKENKDWDFNKNCWKDGKPKVMMVMESAEFDFEPILQGELEKLKYVETIPPFGNQGKHLEGFQRWLKAEFNIQYSAHNIYLMSQLFNFYMYIQKTDKMEWCLVRFFDMFLPVKVAENLLRVLKDSKDGRYILTTTNPLYISNRKMRPDVCFCYCKGEIKSLIELTERELREGNAIDKLYLANEFIGKN